MVSSKAFRLAFAAAASFGAIQYLIPVPRPLLAPRKGSCAADTNFLRQIRLIVLGHTDLAYCTFSYER